MADVLSPAEVEPTIDSILQEFCNDLFLRARAAAENGFNPRWCRSTDISELRRMAGRSNCLHPQQHGYK